MVNNISKIASHFFQNESLDAISENELRYFITQYPYVSAGHLLLAKKLQLSGEKRAFEREVAVTSVYFTNPAWLEFILRNETPGSQTITGDTSVSDLAEIRAADADPVEDASATLTGSLQPGSGHTHQFVVDEPSDERLVSGGELATDKPGSESTNGNVPEEDLPPVQEKSEQLASGNPDFTSDDLKEIAQGETDDYLAVSTHQSDPADPSVLPGEYTAEGADHSESKDEIAAGNAVILLEAEAIAESVDARAAETAEILLDAEATSDGVDESAAETAEILLEAEASVAAIELKAAETAEILLEAEAVAEEINENAADTLNILPGAESIEIEDRALKAAPVLPDNAEPKDADETENGEARDSNTMSDAAMLHISRAGAEAVRAAAGTDNVNLAFDPYHTIDYFASQGIKLKLDDLNKDKLGQQLKSFTEWIRSMKRLPAEISDNVTDDQAQHSIRKIAEHSIEGRDVLTESMAEVWAKQGNFDKARQIYQKLSLQNPSKSTYFASKIDQLKAS